MWHMLRTSQILNRRFVYVLLQIKFQLKRIEKWLVRWAIKPHRFEHQLVSVLPESSLDNNVGGARILCKNQELDNNSMQKLLVLP